MSMNNQQDQRDEEYSFIQEKVIPKRKNTKKKVLKSICITVLLAVVFGVVSSLAFNMSNYLIGKQDKKEKAEPISLSEQEEVLVSQEPVMTEEAVSGEEETPKTTGISDQDIFRAFDLKAYQKVYSVMRNLSEKFKYSMVTVLKYSNDTNVFEVQNSEESYGIILTIEEDYLYVLCNYSRVKDANKLKVEFYNSEAVRAVFMGYDKETGLAILKVKNVSISQRTRVKIKEADLGDSYHLTYGMPVLGLGEPDGTMYSMQIGYITAPVIDKYIVDGKLGFYHTSIPENQYGEGIFINTEGKVVGIITHQYKEDADENMMCFLGISKLKPAIERILNERDKAYLGVKVSELSSDDVKKLNVNYGIYITDIVANSPAFKKGLKVGDVITEIDGVSVSSVAGLMSKIEACVPEDKLTFKIMRRKVKEYPNSKFEEKHITVELGEE